MKTIAFIPARGGSKGVLRKNVRLFCGKPLISHSIEHAMDAPQIDAVFVSTDDEEIAVVSQKNGANVIWRPHSISGDNATSESAITHGIDEIQKNNPDIQTVVFLQVTSPLRPKNAVSNATNRYTSGNYDTLLSVSPTHRFFWKINGDCVTAEYDYMNRPRRQDIKPEDIRYVENGSLYIFSVSHFIKTGNRLGGRIGTIVFDEKFSYEIDSESDFIILEELAKTSEREQNGNH